MKRKIKQILISAFIGAALLFTPGCSHVSEDYKKHGLPFEIKGKPVSISYKGHVSTDGFGARSFHEEFFLQLENEYRERYRITGDSEIKLKGALEKELNDGDNEEILFRGHKSNKLWSDGRTLKKGHYYATGTCEIEGQKIPIKLFEIYEH